MSLRWPLVFRSGAEAKASAWAARYHEAQLMATRERERCHVLTERLANLIGQPGSPLAMAESFWCLNDEQMAEVLDSLAGLHEQEEAKSRINSGGGAVYSFIYPEAQWLMVADHLTDRARGVLKAMLYREASK